MHHLLTMRSTLVNCRKWHCWWLSFLTNTAVVLKEAPAERGPRPPLVSVHRMRWLRFNIRGLEQPSVSGIITNFWILMHIYMSLKCFRHRWEYVFDGTATLNTCHRKVGFSQACLAGTWDSPIYEYDCSRVGAVDLYWRSLFLTKTHFIRDQLI